MSLGRFWRPLDCFAPSSYTTTPLGCPSRHRGRAGAGSRVQIRGRALDGALGTSLWVLDTPDFERFGLLATERLLNEREDEHRKWAEGALLMPGTCGGQDAPGGGWRAALGVSRNSLLRPFCAPILAPLGTGHTDLAPAQRRGHSRANPPKAWCNRAGKASTSD